MIGEELLVETLGHLEHLPGGELLVFFAGEVAANVTGIAARTERLGDEVHFFLELLGIKARQDFHVGALDDLRCQG
jgi:hypothetical protein